MPRPDFDLRALHAALDAQRATRGLSWASATREINCFDIAGHPIAGSTIRGLLTKAVAEGDGVLQMLLWLHRTPESFIPDFLDSDSPRYRLPAPPERYILRWDPKALHTALNAKRQAHSLTWAETAGEIGGHTAGMLTNLAHNRRLGFPGVMRIAGWLEQPAAGFTRVVPRGLSA